MKNRTDNQCWRRWKMLSKKSKEVKRLTDEKIYGPLGIYQTKINMKEPFKIEKKVKKDTTSEPRATDNQNEFEDLEKEEKEMENESKEERVKKIISKKKAKENAKALKSIIKIKNEE